MTGGSFYELAAAARRDEGGIEAGDDELLAEVDQRRDAFLAKMDDDFNTGGAISELFELVRTLNKFIDQHSLEDASARSEEAVASFNQGVLALRELTSTLGLFREPIEVSSGGDDELVGKLMDLMIELRAAARQKKDFDTADQIRDGLTALGITIEDRKDGTEWRIE